MTGGLPTTSEKPRYVAAMFGRIAARYDLMNTVMTGGRDGAWRRAAAAAALPRDVAHRASHVLDVGTGTGKLALAVLEANPTARVVGVDFTLPMLRAAPAQTDGGVAVAGRLMLAGADALHLPFNDAEFDAVLSGFVVRNLADVQRGIAEQLRVLRPGGRLVILETTPGPTGVLRPLYRLYFRRVVPLLGRFIAGDPSAYTYLPESTLAFLEPTHLADVLRRSGLSNVEVQRLALGTVAVTSGRKPPRR